MNTIIKLTSSILQSQRKTQLYHATCRIPTATSHILHNLSCHPPEHKTLAIRYLTHRVKTYPLSEIDRKHELQTMTHILQDNHYHNQQLNILQNKYKMKKEKVQQKRKTI
jgi:hypothetical protein